MLCYITIVHHHSPFLCVCVCVYATWMLPPTEARRKLEYPSDGVMGIVRCRMWGLKTEPGFFGRAQMFFTIGASLSSHPKCFLKWIYADFAPDIKELLKFFQESGNQRTWKFYSKNGFLKVCFLLCLIMCRCVCLHVTLCTWGRYFGGCQSPWRWSYKQLWVTWSGCRDPNSGPLEEQRVLLKD